MSAAREVARVVKEAVEDAEGAETMADLDEFFAFFETEQDAFDRFDEVCFEAEQLAADNGITVDLNCEQ